MRQIQAGHMAKGYSDIGYNFGIDRLGDIYEGRPTNIVGAHTLGHNTDGLGIVFLGTFTDHVPTDQAQASFGELVKFLRNRGDITGPKIMGHRDVFATACPGAALYGILDTLRSLAAGGAPNPVPTPSRKRISMFIPQPGRASNIPGRVAGAFLDSDNNQITLANGASLAYDAVWTNQFISPDLKLRRYIGDGLDGRVKWSGAPLAIAPTDGGIIVTTQIGATYRLEWS
jgi:hypothetical protein